MGIGWTVEMGLHAPRPTFHMITACPSFSACTPHSPLLTTIVCPLHRHPLPMSLNVPDFLSLPPDDSPARNPGPGRPFKNEPYGAQPAHPTTSATTANTSNTSNINTSNTSTQNPSGAGSAHPNQLRFNGFHTDAMFGSDALLGRDTLHSKLALLEQDMSPLRRFSNYPPDHVPAFEPRDAFHLPLELQGGIGTISLRRPSYAAESFTRNPAPAPKNNLASLAAANNFNMNSSLYGFDLLADLFLGFSLNSNLSEFQQRRPSQLAHFAPFQPQVQPYPQPYQPAYSPQFVPLLPFASPPYGQAPANGLPLSHAPAYNQDALPMKLDNGLLLRDQYILASGELRLLFDQVSRYFQDEDVSSEILAKLKELLANPVVGKLTNFIKSLNNLTFNHKMLCLVVNKNGKMDLLLYPTNSNIYLQRNDLVIVDGDRGKDLVMILDPLVSLDMAILFNFLKKIEHLKSLTITDSNGGSSVKNNHCGGTHSTALNALAIINNHANEDNEFIITLPTKQVLRFATPKEIQKLGGKFLEEKKAFNTCYNKIKELGLSNDLTLINVEYQCDFKKLIFYYFANFKRIDFRGLIKELFKIYKTRIWLCAVLPFDRPELYANPAKKGSAKRTAPGIPAEYTLSNEQIMNFSIAEFANLEKANYFHLRNMLNLIDNLMEDVKGNFYGFSRSDGRRPSQIQPSFNPFDNQKLI